jgi:hypothetical protein
MNKTVFLAVLLTMLSSADTIKEIEKTCNAGDAKSCKIMGDLTRAGLGVDKDKAKAEYYYDRACFDGNKDACKELEIMKEDESPSV